MNGGILANGDSHGSSIAVAALTEAISMTVDHAARRKALAMFFELKTDDGGIRQLIAWPDRLGNSKYLFKLRLPTSIRTSHLSRLSKEKFKPQYR